MDPNNVNGMIHVGINGSPYMMLSQNQMVQQQYQIQLQQQMLAQSAYQEVCCVIVSLEDLDLKY